MRALAALAGCAISHPNLLLTGIAMELYSHENPRPSSLKIGRLFSRLIWAATLE
jgi:hypothetical protein